VHVCVIIVHIHRIARSHHQETIGISPWPRGYCTALTSGPRSVGRLSIERGRETRQEITIRGQVECGGEDGMDGDPFPHSTKG